MSEDIVMDRSKRIKEQAAALQEKMVDIRREIHQHPELGFQEYHTTDLIVQELDKLQIPYRRLEPTGVVADLGNAGSKRIALRADMDALPIQEETGYSFRSCIDKVMHACGHDTHVAMLLGAAEILKSLEEELPGQVRLIFQPAEELAGGADVVIEQGVLKGVDAIFGIHSSAGQPVGKIMASKGPIFAASASFRIVVTGQKCHGAFPHSGNDATVAGAALVLAIKSAMAQEQDAQRPLVVSVGSFHSDGSHNVIAGEAVLEGTVRSYDRDAHVRIKEVLERISSNVAEAYRCQASVEYKVLTEVLINEDALVDLGMEAAKKLTGVEPDPSPRFMGSEDFAAYTMQVPGAYLFVGIGGDQPSHCGKFWVEEAGFQTGAALYAQLAVDALEKLNK